MTPPSLSKQGTRLETVCSIENRAYPHSSSQISGSRKDFLYRRSICRETRQDIAMANVVLRFFRTGPDLPLIEDPKEVERVYEKKRFDVFLWLTIGYGFFYTCRLSLSVAKKPMLDAGVLGVDEMGFIGSMLFYVYAFGKCTNGFLSDRANIRRFMSVALLLSAITNLLFGLTSVFFVFAILWGLNGWFQSIGSAPSVVSICQWYSHGERGTRYGIWAGAHNIGEGLTFLGTAMVVSALGWEWGFIGPGIACFFIALVLYLKLADRPETYGLPQVSIYRNDFTGGSASSESVGALQLIVLKHPLVWVLGLSSACMYVGRYAVNSWAIFYLQEAKAYGLVEAGAVMAAYPLFGFIGAILSGYTSDRFFKSRRNLPTLFYGFLQTGALNLLFLVPPGNFWLDALALGIFGFGVGGLIVFLAGLIAVDILPKRAAGAVKGIIGLFSYLGAATQDWVSGLLIENTKTIIDGVPTFDFGNVFIFWVGACIASMILALAAWNAKPHE